MSGRIREKLTLNEMRSLVVSLSQLNQLDSKMKKASDDGIEANKRWNAARIERHELHQKIIHQYGQENAPLWIESLHGKLFDPIRSNP